jgi:glycosyltransferase involved in cell wall biosynthesis
MIKIKIYIFIFLWLQAFSYIFLCSEVKKVNVTGVKPYNENELWEELKDFNPKEEKPIVVIIPSFNNKDWYKNNIDSVLVQKYKNYHVIYIDDASPDGTGALVDKYIKEKKLEDKITLIKNKKRLLAMENLYNAIHSCDDRVIIATLDGDDWLNTDHVFSLLNKIYSDQDVWITYGQFKRYPKPSGYFCKPFPENVIKSRSFRKYKWVSSQLRTFYCWLFKKIKKEDFLYKGSFFPMAWDLAFMFPMLEMAGHRVKFIPDVIYIYNKATQISDFTLNRPLQLFLEGIIRKRPIYPLIKEEPKL